MLGTGGKATTPQQKTYGSNKSLVHAGIALALAPSARPLPCPHPYINGLRVVEHDTTPNKKTQHPPPHLWCIRRRTRCLFLIPWSLVLVPCVSYRSSPHPKPIHIFPLLPPFPSLPFTYSPFSPFPLRSLPSLPTLPTSPHFSSLFHQRRLRARGDEARGRVRGALRQVRPPHSYV